MDTPQRSYYVTGGTMSSSAASYMVRQADTDLYENLIRGELCYVLNARQMGKSSLMVRTAEKLRQHGIIVAVLDLTAIGNNLSPAQWYDGLLARLGRQLDLEDELDDFYSSRGRFGPLQRWQEALEQVVLPYLARTRQNKALSGPATADVSLVIFVDEIDVVRSLPFSADEFFSALRQCFVGRATNPDWRRITFCLIGTATPAELIQDTRTSPFNVGRRIDLRDFTLAEAKPLGEGFASLFPESSPNADTEKQCERLLNRVLYWTDGHPYLTQRLCRAIVEHLGTSGGSLSAVVDTVCSDLFLSHRGRETDDNLTFVRHRLLRSEVDTGSLLDLLRQMRDGKRVPDDEADPLAVVLKFSGVAKSEKGVLRIRNRMYAAVFDAEWALANTPNAALQRLRNEYRETTIKALTLFVGILLLPMLTVGMLHLSKTVFQRTLAVIGINVVTALLVFTAFGVLFRPRNVSLKQIAALNLLMLAVVSPFTLAVSPIDPYIRLGGEFYFSIRWTVPLAIFLLKDAFLNLIFLPFYWVWQKRFAAEYSPLTHAFLFSTGSVLLVYAGACYLQSGLYATYPISELSFYKVGFATLYTTLMSIAICLGWGIMGYAVGVGSQQKKIPWRLLGAALAIRMVLDFSFTHAITLLSVIFSLLGFSVCAYYLLKKAR